MSSAYQARPSTPQPANGQPGSRIVHFDATERRREKMRRAAGQSTEGAAPAAPRPIAPPRPAAPVAPPRPAAPIAAKPVAPPAKPAVPAAPVAPRPAAPLAAKPAPAPARPAPVANGHAAGANGSAPRPAAAPAAPVAQAAPAAAASGARMNPKQLEQFLINFVVEQTGYPAEMVELDADLEADLGIDSIKKAQLFGELGEHFVVQLDESLSLDQFPTLRHVMDFLKDQPTKTAGGAPAAANGHTAPLAAKPAAPAAPIAPPRPAIPAPVAAKPPAAPAAPARVSPAPVAAPQPAGMSGAALESFLVNFVVEQTGYPAEMVELDADLEADLGIDSIKKAQLFGELGEHFVVQLDESLSLDQFPTLRHVVQFLDGKPARAAGAAPAAAPALPAPSAPPARVAAPAPSVGYAASGAASSAATAVASAPPMSEAELETFLVNFVVEQTGYPAEMVELDADLEADLGIDSIKKAQLFGELGEHFIVQLDESLSLDQFPTLRHVMAFLANAERK